MHSCTLHSGTREVRLLSYRAPVLVAIALIEIGMEKLNAIQLIRMKRKGAINMQQYTSFMKYKKIGFKGKQDSCCLIF
jgi:hypothetical protein